MSLRDFVEEFHIGKRKLFVTICINQLPGGGGRSQVNRMLEKIIHSLKKELEDYKEIQIAYVYETNSLMTVREFTKLEKETPVLYKEICDQSSIHKLSHIFFMGMSLLEREASCCNIAEYRLYLVTDEKFTRVNHIVYQDGEEIRMNPRFEKTNVKFVLVKSEHAGGDLVEEYIRRSPRGTVWTVKGAQFEVC